MASLDGIPAAADYRRASGGRRGFGILVVGILTVSKVSVTAAEKAHIDEVYAWGLRGTPGDLAASSDLDIFGASSRRLTGERRCNKLLLNLMPPPAVVRYSRCVNTRLNSENTSHAGANAAIAAECWCENKLTDVMNDLNCCGKDDYESMCQINCEPDCDDSTTQTCLDTCSPLCLEEHYEGENCLETCRENGCMKQILCIADHSRLQTTSGKRGRVCDEAGFYANDRVKKYNSCYGEWPLRTHWERINAENYCMCDQELKESAQEHTCCGSSFFSKSICNRECLSDTDCSSAEAQKCLTECASTCPRMVNGVTEECHEMCVLPTSNCYKYRVCKPLKTRQELEFDYVCPENDADSPTPQKNGCCTKTFLGGLLVMEGCPSLCVNQNRYVFDHGSECRCDGCPSTKEETKTKLSEAVKADIYSNGLANAQVVAREIGLSNHQPTPKMLDLVKRRNQEVIDKMSSDLGTDHSQAILDINEKYNELLEQQARIDKGRMDKGMLPQDDEQRTERDQLSPRGQPRGKTPGGSNMGMIITVIVSVIVIICCGASVLYLLFMRVRPSKMPPPALPEAIEPTGSDTNVVVGRPVNAASTEQGVVGGAPVQATEAEKDWKASPSPI